MLDAGLGLGEVCVGDGLAEVGDGLAEVGDGDGLADAGDGDGLADVSTGGTALLGTPAEALAPLDEGVLALPGDALPEPRNWEPLPCGLPFPVPVPGFELLLPVPLSNPTTVRMDPRAKTPATTSTTAPATARAGRNHAIARWTGCC